MSRSEMQQGRGGMGSHKHGVSGNGGPSPRFKQNRAREASREIERLNQAAQRRRKIRATFATVADALKDRR